MADAITGPLADMFPDVVLVAAPSWAPDGFGAVSVGADVEYRARVVGRVKRVQDGAGQVRTSMMHAIFASAPTLSVLHRYTLPAWCSTNPADANDLAARRPAAIALDLVPDENGPHHVTVYF